MKVDKTKLMVSSIDDIKHDLKEIEHEFERDNIMHPMSYARAKELEDYKKILQKELARRGK